MEKDLYLKEIDLQAVGPDSKELEKYIDNKRATQSCADFLNKAINENYDGYRLNVQPILISALEKFSPERIAYVLAVRVYGNDGFDGRISKDNEEWAASLLADVPDLFKDKKASPIRSELSGYLCQHNGLADILISSFRKVFPEIRLEKDIHSIVSEIRPKENGAQAPFDKFDTDFNEDLDDAYLCFEMEISEASVELELLKRVEDFEAYHHNMSVSEFIVKTSFDEKLAENTFRNRCYVDVYEDGTLALIIGQHEVPISLREVKSLNNTLQEYTLAHYKATLSQTVNAAMKGISPKELRTKGLANKRKGQDYE